ncbi:ABC transporter substrate-binding protein [Oleiagrimonas sp.]|uniref:ABC transporter substrate-binding protein n=1 Tax=Oleiagrimonas sp. TaxID=2010330 RepID=UPI002616FA7E|nr:ABC transporter substrate-binding protein [Oleiagrimonas sp.]MDA3912985.1 ABC transporter substrate-binding protein [Oleiagrimonas sp.]
MLRRSVMRSLLVAAALAASFAVWASPPSMIKIGTLYAGSGKFSQASTRQYDGLKYWAKEINAKGGVYVKAFDKKIPVKLVAYNDQSSTTLAASLYNRLITQDRVNLLVADYGSVLTSVAIPLARVHKVLLFDETGTSGKFFEPKDKNRYIVLTGLPTSSEWPKVLADFMQHVGIKKVAILYASNDWSGSQADTLNSTLKSLGVEVTFYESVPDSTSSYSTILRRIAATNPEAVAEFGYSTNDIAFLQNYASSGLHFKMMFVPNPALHFDVVRNAVGDAAIKNVYSYVAPPLIRYNKQVNFGPTLDRFEAAYTKAGGKNIDLSTVAGYNTGLIMGKALAEAPKFTQESLRDSIDTFSGKIFTLDGLFKVNAEGAQIGESLPVGQVLPTKKGLALLPVFPLKNAAAKYVYPQPANP